MEHTRHCSECPLNGRSDLYPGAGPTDAKFCVVVDQPSAKPDTYGALMQPAALSLLGKMLAAEGFTGGDVYIRPRVLCPYDPDTLSTKEKTLVGKCCRPHLVEFVRQHRFEAVIPLGADASRQVFGRAVKITEVRGTPVVSDEIGCTVLPTINPLVAVMYEQNRPTLASDIATLGRLVDHDYDVEGAVSAVLGEYTLVDDLQFLVDQAPEFVGFDTETSTLKWFHDGAKILTMQFSIEEGKAYVLSWDHPDRVQSKRAKARLKKQIIQLLCRDAVTVVGQNLKHDVVYLAAHTGIRVRVGGCTLNMASLLDENSMTKNLDDLVKRYAPALAGYADGFNATVDKSRMEEMPLDRKFIDYAGGDADACLRVYHAMHNELDADPKLRNYYYRVTLPGLDAFASIEMRGLLVDAGAADEFEEFMEDDLGERYAALIRQVPKSIRRKHVDEALLKAPKRADREEVARGALSFSRPAFIRDWLFYHPDGLKLKPKVFTKTTAKLDDARKVPSVSTKDHLPFFYDNHPVVYELAEYIKADRLLTTNVQGFRAKYVYGEYVRSTYNLHKAVTGRSSSEDPNSQNYPKRGKIAKAYRRMFVAPPGKVILEVDYSQAEIRIAADMARDRTMIEIYRNCGDVHRATACAIMGLTEEQFLVLPEEEQKTARTKAKAVVFGFIYGMWWRKFSAYAKTQYNVEFTDAESKRTRELFFEKYDGLEPWHGKMKSAAHSRKYVRSYSGRVRHLPMIDSPSDLIRQEAERQAVNAPVQEFGSSLGVTAMGRMELDIDPQYLEIVAFVHDAIYAYVPEEYAVWGAQTIKWYMETIPIKDWFGVTMRVPLVAEAGVGMNLGDIHEMHGLEVPKYVEDIDPSTYDVGLLWDEENKKGIQLCEQEIPPNNGFLHTSGLFTVACP